jgi:transposase
VWIDEAGFLLAPLLRRTWGLRGQRPVSEQRTSQRDKVSAIAALTLSPVAQRPGLYFQTFPGEYVTGTEVASFLRDLLKHLRGQVVLLCDRGTMHQGDPIWALLGDYAGRLTMAYLPPYAPKLNPVEWLWSWLKYGQLANYFPGGVGELDETVRGKLGAALLDPELLRGFFEGSSFPLPQRADDRKQAA